MKENILRKVKHALFLFVRKTTFHRRRNTTNRLRLVATVFVEHIWS